MSVPLYRGRGDSNTVQQGGGDRGSVISTREVDLHFYIQGYECKALESPLADLCSKAHFMLIKTHSRVIDGKLVELPLANNWQFIDEKPRRSSSLKSARNKRS